MNNRLTAAKNSLAKHNYTCVILSDKTEYHTTLRGVKPLLDCLASGVDFTGAYAADKVVGAGAAHLYVLLGVAAVWAAVISEVGRAILQANGIEVVCEQEVAYIVNRTGNGMCPIEKAVTGITDSQKALIVIKQTLEILSKQA